MSSKAIPAKTTSTLHVGHRLSYDGSLCTVRWIGHLEATRGEWIGVEWDDPKRGKHRGIHQGARIFECVRREGTPASFIRPTRSPDHERTVIEAIKFKYGDSISSHTSEPEAVVISGKVAEEVGFAKVAQEQARLSELRIVLIDQLVVSGIAPRDSAQHVIQEAQKELAEVCPSIEELDLGFNIFESWQGIADICAALPKLTRLRVGGLRLSSCNNAVVPNPFTNVIQLYLDECLVTHSDVAAVLSGFTRLQMLNLSNNQLDIISELVDSIENGQLDPLTSLESLYLDNNDFRDLDCMLHISKVFPNASTISIGANMISDMGQQILSLKHGYPQVDILNLQDNLIQSIQFLDAVSTVFPTLTSLRVSGNPFYKIKDGDTDPRATDKPFYLSLARIPTLKDLNFGLISTKDREEGEIYYLSVVGQDIQTLLSSSNTTKTLQDLAKDAIALYPRYQDLCQKYARESVIDRFLSSPDSSPLKGQEASQKTIKYPQGSLGARLVTTTFYISSAQVPLSPTMTEQLPLSLPVSSLMARVSRHHAFKNYLAPLQFNLVYESTEFDPVDTTAESSTRSRIYARGHRLSKEEKENLWKQWGDWDADVVVEKEEAKSSRPGNKEDEAVNGHVVSTNLDAVEPAQLAIQEEHWMEKGVVMRDGREWKRREVPILHSVRRPWGDWIDIESGGPEREVRIRIEPFTWPKAM